MVTVAHGYYVAFFIRMMIFFFSAYP